MQLALMHRLRPSLSCCIIGIQLALGCPAQKAFRPFGSPAYLSQCTQIDRHSEQWTVKVDFELAPGERLDNNDGFILPTPEQGFWLKSVHVMIVDRNETERFMWPPMHLHHIVCRSSRADVWYDQEVFYHSEPVFAGAGAAFWNRYIGSYELINASDGWAKYHPANTTVRCGIRVDDDRLHGESRRYALSIMLHVDINADRQSKFLGRHYQSFDFLLWEGTTTGQIGYNMPKGNTTVLSTEYCAPKAGSFHSAHFDCHTHPGGKSMELIAKRLHGQEFSEPQHLLTIKHTSMIVEPGPQSESLNVRPGSFMRRPALIWSKMGLSWLHGNLSTQGIGHDVPCYFQAGDIFYTRSIYENEEDMINTMMILMGLVLWSEPTQEVSSAKSSHPVQQPGFSYAGGVHSQLFDPYYAPYDLMAQVPQTVNESVLVWLHERMPLFFGHPQRTREDNRSHCLTVINSVTLFTAISMKDLDEPKLLSLQQSRCSSG